jgi:hypothetical protein
MVKIGLIYKDPRHLEFRARLKKISVHPAIGNNGNPPIPTLTFR